MGGFQTVLDYCCYHPFGSLLDGIHTFLWDNAEVWQIWLYWYLPEDLSAFLLVSLTPSDKSWIKCVCIGVIERGLLTFTGGQAATWWHLVHGLGLGPLEWTLPQKREIFLGRHYSKQGFVILKYWRIWTENLKMLKKTFQIKNKLKVM